MSLALAQVACDGNPWQLIETHGAIKVFRSDVAGSKVKRFKASCTFAAPPAFVSAWCMDVPKRLSWDKQMGGIEVRARVV